MCALHQFQDPNQGGCTRFQGLLLTEPRPYPNPDRPPHPPWTLTQEYKSGKATMALIAGYLGSVVIGGVFIVSLVCQGEGLMEGKGMLTRALLRGVDQVLRVRHHR
jgi:hypothetical protein